VVTAEMLDAAKAGAKVADYLGSDWTKLFDGRWDLPSWAPHSPATLISTHGPLSNLRPPSQPVPTIPVMTDAEEADSRRFWAGVDQREALTTRGRLLAAVHHATAEHYDGLVEPTMAAQAAQAAALEDVDRAARAHVVALDGPALVVPRAMTSYDPAKLAPGSVIVAKQSGVNRRRVYVRDNEAHEHPGLCWWIAPWGNADRPAAISADDVPTSGVLVVDGAQLGGTR
jgi:hypothetical protein